jgi:hypothetical protein
MQATILSAIVALDNATAELHFGATVHPSSDVTHSLSGVYVMNTRSIINRFRRTASLGVLTLLAGSLLNLAVAPGISAAAAATQPSVTPSVSGPGTRFSFVASGFKGDPDEGDDQNNDAEKVSFWINTPDGQTIKATDDTNDKSYERASRDGQAEWSWVAPADALQGAYTLVAHGNESGHEVLIPFQIEGSTRGLLMAESYTVTPSAGTPAASFRFVINGFLGDPKDGDEDKSNNAEKVAFWINTPDGQTIKAIRAGADEDDFEASVDRASRSGQVELTWQAPANATPGTYTLVAHGLESEREQVIAFEIR